MRENGMEKVIKAGEGRSTRPTKCIKQVTTVQRMHVCWLLSFFLLAHNSHHGPAADGKQPITSRSQQGL